MLFRIGGVAVTRKMMLFVNVRGEGLSLDRVRAELRLPERGEGWIRVRLYPQVPVATAFDMPFEWTLTGDVTDVGGTVVTHVEAPRVWTRDVSHLRWDRETTDTTVKGCADEVTLTHLSRSKGDSSKKQLTYFLSPGPALRSARIVTRRKAGAANARTTRRAAVPLTGRERLTFLAHEGWKGKKQKKSRSILVGKVRSSRTAPSVLPEVEDVLALASVAMRHRVVCTGWAQTGTGGIVECFRGNVRAPRQDPWDENNALVPQEHLASFLVKAHGRLRHSPQAALLRQVAQQVVPRRREGIDQRFTRLFSALESIVLLWSRAKKREHLLSKKQDRAVRRAVHEVLTRHVRSKEKRSAVEQKLGELNRPAIAASFLQTCRQANVALDDLWPLDNQDGLGLRGIRNKFSHGEHVPYHPGLETAGDHLQWTVERLLLATLGWPIEKTRVRPESLGFLVAYGSWSEERKALTRATAKETNNATGATDSGTV